MSFWGERYRRPDEEDIWEELKQMLLNSVVHEAEKNFRKPESWMHSTKLGIELMEWEMRFLE